MSNQTIWLHYCHFHLKTKFGGLDCSSEKDYWVKSSAFLSVIMETWECFKAFGGGLGLTKMFIFLLL